MKTVSGYEAIGLAEELNMTLYDLDYHHEITVEQARQFLESGRKPKAFVIRNWPDTDEEAEQTVLNHFHLALRLSRSSETRIIDMATRTTNRLPIHVHAAELAAERLVEQNKLEVVQANSDYSVYRIPRTVYFREDFLKSMGQLVCEECAQLDVHGPFHQPCLTELMNYLKNANLSFSDITEVRSTARTHRQIPRILPDAGLQWLSKTASATTLKWKSVIKPMFTRDVDNRNHSAHESDFTQHTVIAKPELLNRDGSEIPNSDSNVPDSHAPDRDALDSTVPDSNHLSGTVAPGVHTEDAKGPIINVSGANVQEGNVSKGSRLEDQSQRTKITKSQLIQYLQSVEVLDEYGELTRLHTERKALLERLAEKDREIERIEKQRAFLDKQCKEMQRDMDTLIHAMQIAKRRGQTSSTQVVDAAYEVKQQG